jgi:hypothetical protein
MQQKQRTDDLEEELQLLQKHLKSTQEQVADQVDDNITFSFQLKFKSFSHKKLRI